MSKAAVPSILRAEAFTGWSSALSQAQNQDQLRCRTRFRAPRSLQARLDTFYWENEDIFDGPYRPELVHGGKSGLMRQAFSRWSELLGYQ